MWEVVVVWVVMVMVVDCVVLVVVVSVVVSWWSVLVAVCGKTLVRRRCQRRRLVEMVEVVRSLVIVKRCV